MISYPLPISTFFERLFLQDAALVIDRLDENASRIASGDFITKNLGPSVWRAELATVLLPDEEAIDIQAMVNSLRGSEKPFLAYNVRRPYPKADPTGSIIGVNVVRIRALGADKTSLQLKGLTAGYVLTRGDFISFEYGVGRSVAYHQTLETITADGSGDTASFEVEPQIRTGAAVDAVVTLKKATILLVIVPQSVKLTSENVWSRVSFQAIQTMQSADPVIAPSMFTDADIFHSPTVTPAASDLTPALFNPGDTFFSPVVTTVKPLVASHFADTDVFFAPAVVLGGILPDRYIEADGFFTPTVTQP